MLDLDKSHIAEELAELDRNSPDEFQEQIDGLDDQYKTIVLAELKVGDEYSPILMRVWTELAAQLDNQWLHDPKMAGTGIRVIIKGNLIQRRCTPDELFTNLVNHIHTERALLNRREEDAAEIDRLKGDVQAAIRGDSRWFGDQTPGERPSERAMRESEPYAEYLHLEDGPESDSMFERNVLSVSETNIEAS